MLKRSKTDKTPRYEGPPRLLIVDDNPDAARLLGKLFRREGFEVAEVNDHQVALVALANEPNPISAVVSSFSTAGTGASVKLLDAVRNHHDPRVNTARMGWFSSDRAITEYAQEIWRVPLQPIG